MQPQEDMNIFLLAWGGRNLMLHLLQDNQYRWDWVGATILDIIISEITKTNKKGFFDVKL
jgi:hypothetical protein